MAEKSAIQWTDATWNPWHGCRKVSDGCKFCYMYRDKERYGQDPTTVLRSKTTFNDPLKWKEPQKVFTCSWSDFFIEEADGWRDDAWKIIKATPHLTYQILTKRPENILDRLPDDWGDGYENVWMGVSVENQKAATERIPILLDAPAQVRFLSIEPLLENVNFARVLLEHKLSLPAPDNWLPSSFTIPPKIDQIIVGGESGNENGKYRYRVAKLDWFIDLVAQGRFARSAIFIKQLGTHLAKEMRLKDSHGGDITEFPPDLQIREMPR